MRCRAELREVGILVGVISPTIEHPWPRQAASRGGMGENLSNRVFPPADVRRSLSAKEHDAVEVQVIMEKPG